MTAAPRTGTSSPTVCVDEPRRVVVAVAPPGPVDEDDVVLRPIFSRQRARHASPEAARRRALRSFFTCGGTASSAGGDGPGPRRVRKDVHLRDPGRLRQRRACRWNARSSSVGKPTMTSVVRLKSVERLEPAQVRGGRVAPPHRARGRRSSPDWSGTCRWLPTVGVSRSARHELVVDVVDLDRREAQPRAARHRADLANEARQRVASVAVAEAAEVDPGEDDLAVPLRDATAHLGEHGLPRERLREAPRTSGMTQKLHEKLQPSWIFTNARMRSRRASAWTQPIAPTSPATKPASPRSAARRRSRSSGRPANASRRGSRRSR